MGFSVGSYAKIKEVENKGNYSKAKLTISKKIKDSNPAQYVCTFVGWVTCVGNAHSKSPTAGQKIKITNCDVNNGYLDRDGTQKFNNAPQFTLYDYELDGQSPMPNGNGYMPSGYGGNNSMSSGFDDIPLDSSLPF